MGAAEMPGGDAFASLRRYWWVILLYGLASVGVGILMLVWPGKALTVISVAFGIIVIACPGIGVVTLAVIVAIVLLLRGSLLLAEGLAWRRA